MIKMKKVPFILLLEVFILLLMSHVNVFATEHVEGTIKKTTTSRHPPHQGENLRAQKPTDWESDAFKALQRAFYQTAFFKGFTDKQLDAIQEDIQHTIHQSEILRNEGKYAEALRLLFDAMYMEQRTQLLLGMDNERMFPTIAAEKKHELEMVIITEEQSPLMRLFRDPNALLEEKQQYLSKLYTIVRYGIRNDDDTVFLQKYNGAFVQILMSSALSQGEKFDLLTSLKGRIQKNYTAFTQYERIKREILQLQGLADKEFQAEHYVETFILLSEILQKKSELPMQVLSREEDGRIFQQQIDLRKRFVQVDTSPLMEQLKRFRFQQKKRKQFLTELERQLHKTSGNMPDSMVFQGKEYTGTLVQILHHPDVRWMIKYNILQELKKY